MLEYFAAATVPMARPYIFASARPRLGNPHPRDLDGLVAGDHALGGCCRKPRIDQADQHLDGDAIREQQRPVHPVGEPASSSPSSAGSGMPTWKSAAFRCRFVAEMVGAVGIEPTTSPV